MIHLSNFLRYEFISNVDLLCLFFSKYVIFYQLLFFVSFLCIQVVGKKKIISYALLVYTTTLRKRRLLYEGRSKSFATSYLS